MRRWFLPVAMISLGFNLLVGFQNCAEVDPEYVYQIQNPNEKGSKKAKLAENLYLQMSEMKIQKSEVTRYQRSVRYEMKADFRVKYTMEYLGAMPELNTENLAILDSKDNIVAEIEPQNISIVEKSCVESVDQNTKTYFDCKYQVEVEQKLAVSSPNFRKDHFRLGGKRGVLEISMTKGQFEIKTKDYIVVSEYQDRFVKAKKPTLVKKKAPIPKIKKRVAKKIKVQKKPAKVKKIAKKAPIKKKLTKKKIEKKKIVEGIYCHIQVLNPPHLELLSDVKKTGIYYEDAMNCKEVAVRLSKRYCNRSLMGEIDYNLSIKDKSKQGTKLLERHIESIQCGDLG